MTESKINKYKVVDYFDVWGNAEDGWQVNNLTSYYDTDETCLRISEDATDKEILEYLVQIGYLKTLDESVKITDLVHLESYDNEMIEIVRTVDDFPLGRLEMII